MDPKGYESNLSIWYSDMYIGTVHETHSFASLRVFVSQAHSWKLSAPSRRLRHAAAAPPACRAPIYIAAEHDHRSLRDLMNMLRVCRLDFVTFRENGRSHHLDHASFWHNGSIVHAVHLAAAELIFSSNTSDGF